MKPDCCTYPKNSDSPIRALRMRPEKSDSRMLFDMEHPENPYPFMFCNGTYPEKSDSRMLSDMEHPENPYPFMFCNGTYPEKSDGSIRTLHKHLVRAYGHTPLQTTPNPVITNP